MRKFVHHKTVVAAVLLTLALGWGGSLAAQTGPIGFRISGASVTEKDTFTVAVRADTLLTGWGVTSYRFYITYSPTYFEFIGMEGTGPVLTPWGAPEVNSANAGTLIMAGAGATPLTGNGEMIYLRFRSNRSGSSAISFNSSQSYLNEGNPASAYAGGTVSSAALSYPNIFPDQASLYIGNEVQMGVSGGTAPFVYSTDNPEVVVISDVDRVRAVGPGTTRVRVTDSKGEVSVTTGLFDVRAVRVDMEEVSVWPADLFYIPVKLEVASGTTLYSGRFDLAHSTGLTGISGSIVQGDFQVMIENNAKSGRMTVSFASTTGITGDGILCYLRFRANTSGNQFVRFENVRFNETLLAWPVKATYYMNVRSLPTLSMSPNSGTLMWGETVKLNVSNGTAPYTYSVSNPSVATIDEQGNLTAITGGTVRVTATDVNGATMTSGIFTVTDNHVSIYSTEGILDTETRVPIISTSLPSGKAIYGYKATFSFSETYLEFVGVEPAGSGGLMTASQSGNSVEVAAAMSQGVSSGLLGYLVFNIRQALALNATTNITFNAFSANENSIISTRGGGTVRRVEQTSYRPVAIAGLDFSLQEGTVGQLDGSASFDLDNDPLTYLWTAPEGIILSDPTGAKPEFMAPYVEENTVFTFTLVVNDGTDDSDPDEVRVTVLQVNNPPVANAGASRNIVEGSSVSLDGSGSYDPDGDALSYSWKALDGIILFNPNSVSPSFILPQVTVNTSYRFTLVVNDGALASQSDTVTITAINVNKKPVAFAGGDFSVNELEEATLDGSLSYDADNDPLTYRWTAPPGVPLSDATAAKPAFTAPAVVRDSVIRFVLVVNDGFRDSDPDEVRVTVKNVDILNTETMILDLTAAGVDSFAIDTTMAVVSLFVPYGQDIRSLAPLFTLSEGAFIQPANGSARNFSTPVYYTVYAEDGVTSRMWRVEVFRGEATMQRDLAAGWNWISLNVQPAAADIGSLFGGLTLSEQDYIKSAAYSSVYYAATGWFGNLSVFPQQRMVKFRKEVAEQLTVQGTEINPAITAIPLVRGWNDIAYLLRSDAAVDAAFDLSTLPAGEVVLKGRDGSAVYFAGSGWTGELETLEVLHGYRINVASAGNLRYDPAASAKKSLSVASKGATSVTGPGSENGTSASNGTEPATADANTARRKLLQEYGLQPERYEHSATLIAEVVSAGGKRFTGAGDLLLAYHGSEIRGAGRASYVPPLGRHIFVMSYYGDEEDVEIDFRLKRGEEEYATDLVTGFRSDAITGEAHAPWQLVVADVTVDVEEMKGSRGRLSVYPNPVREWLTVSSEAPVQEIRLYDISGKMVRSERPGTGNMVRSEQPGTGKMVRSEWSGTGNITLDMQEFTPGVYTLEVLTEQEVLVRRILKASN
jgi:hypothetical protein